MLCKNAVLLANASKSLNLQLRDIQLGLEFSKLLGFDREAHALELRTQPLNRALKGRACLTLVDWEGRLDTSTRQAGVDVVNDVLCNLSVNFLVLICLEVLKQRIEL